MFYLDHCTVVLRQTAVTAYLKSKQLLLFVFAEQCNGDVYWIIMVDLTPWGITDQIIKAYIMLMSPFKAFNQIALTSFHLCLWVVVSGVLHNHLNCTFCPNDDSPTGDIRVWQLVDIHTNIMVN